MVLLKPQARPWAHLELARAAQPHVVHARQVGHAVAGLVHGDAARVAGHELVEIEVHVAVAHAASVARPAHLHAHFCHQGL